MAALGEMPGQDQSRGAASVAAGSPHPARKGPLVPHPPSRAQGPQRRGRLAHGSAGSGRTARVRGAQPSWQPAGRAPGGGTRAGNPAHRFLPSARRHPRDTIFVKKVLHICSAAAGQENHSGPDQGDESSSDSPGHVRSKLSPARTPPPRSPGLAGQDPSRPPFAPSPRSRCFGIVLPPNTHRCRNLENFHATQVLFPERGCKFLLSWGRADAQPGCMAPPSPASKRQTRGAMLGKVR